MPDDRLAYESGTPVGTVDDWRTGWLDLTGRVRAEIPSEEKMSKAAEDIGVIIALVNRFTEQRLPKVIAVTSRYSVLRPADWQCNRNKKVERKGLLSSETRDVGRTPRIASRSPMPFP